MEKTVEGIRELFDGDGILQHLWVMVISLLAGIVGHIERIQNHDEKKFIALIFIYDMITSSFVGFIALYACLSAGIDIYMIGVIVGMSAHSGTKGLGAILKIIAGKYKVSVKIDAKDEGKK